MQFNMCFEIIKFKKQRPWDNTCSLLTHHLSVLFSSNCLKKGSNPLNLLGHVVQANGQCYPCHVTYGIQTQNPSVNQMPRSKGGHL
jgi:hypothetical protein